MADPVARPAPDRFSRTFHWAGYALGFGIGGFFDGILLHQILQWHHLLSGLQGAPYDDLRFQVLADGLFHVFMYVVTVIGLWLLWQSMAVVVFRPGITPAEAFVAMSSVGGRLVWSDASDQVWAIDLPEDARTFELYRCGALMVSNSFLPVGCLNWFEVPASEVTS